MEMLIAFACFWFAWSSIQELRTEPIADWGIAQYILALITMVLVVFGVWYARRAWNTEKKKAADRKAEQAQQVKEKQQQQREELYEDLSYLDEDLDADAQDEAALDETLEAHTGDEADEG